MTPIQIAGPIPCSRIAVSGRSRVYVRSIRDDQGSVIFDAKPTNRSALDPSGLPHDEIDEEVLRSGTGAVCGARGFGLPAPEKTGTSHDGWFAGFTRS